MNVQDEMDTLVARAEASGGAADAEALFVRLGSNGWLGGMAMRYGLDLERLVRAELVFAYEWGVRFERGNQRAAKYADWQNSYFDRANQFARQLGVDEPFEEPDYRLRGDYGGPF
jgi:hypothetical protein